MRRAVNHLDLRSGLIEGQARARARRRAARSPGLWWFWAEVAFTLRARQDQLERRHDTATRYWLEWEERKRRR